MADGWISTLRPVSHVPQSMTSQRTFQDASSNRKSHTIPIVPSLASIAKPFKGEMTCNMF